MVENKFVIVRFVGVLSAWQSRREHNGLSSIFNIFFSLPPRVGDRSVDGRREKKRRRVWFYKGCGWYTVSAVYIIHVLRRAIDYENKLIFSGGGGAGGAAAAVTTTTTTTTQDRLYL